MALDIRPGDYVIDQFSKKEGTVITVLGSGSCIIESENGKFTAKSKLLSFKTKNKKDVNNS